MQKQILVYRVFDSIEKSVAKLAAKIITRGQSLMIYSPIKERIAAIDSSLWTSPKDSFIPHEIAGSEIDDYCKILLTSDIDIAANAKGSIILIDNVDYSLFINNKENVILFCHRNDPESMPDIEHSFDVKYYTEDSKGKWTDGSLQSDT